MGQTVGQRLRKKRIEYGYTMAELAKAIGVSKGNISSYESDRNIPHAKTLIKFSDCFNCSIDWILTGKEHSSKAVPFTPTLSEDASELLDYLSVFDAQDTKELLLLAELKYQKYIK